MSTAPITQIGYFNRNGQITIRNTQQAGSDHQQYVYQLARSQCGYNYGSNGSDIFDRKCPRMSGRRHGLPCDHSRLATASSKSSGTTATSCATTGSLISTTSSS